jgi:hypothetical protein
MNGFQCWTDDWGDVWVADGVLIQPSADGLFRVGGEWGLDNGVDASPPRPDDLVAVPVSARCAFIGGSGRNLVASGLPAGYSGPVSPNGFYRPAEDATWRRGAFVLVVTGSSAATISDGTDTIAELSSGGTAPAGSYVATTYGEDTYNGGTAFTLTVAAESATPAAAPKAASTVSAGTGPAGEWTPTSHASYELDSDTDWTIVIDPDGSAEILDGATVIATRAEGLFTRPDGRYEATAAGKTAHNSGEEWFAYVRLIPAAPLAGYAYLEVAESAGVVSAVTGPFFGALPTAGGGSSFIPLAQFDGSGGGEQFFTGPILWP